MLSRWALVVAGLGCASLARADAPRAHLTLERPMESFCPTADVLSGDVAALAGRPVFTADPHAETEVHCDISEHASGVTARIDVHAADGTPLGTRELSAPAGECASLRRPLALVLWMLLDREEPAAPSEAPPVAKPGRRSFPLGFGVEAGGQSGILPRVAPGFGLVVMPQLAERLTLRLDAAYWLPVTAQTAHGAGATFQAFTFGGGACPSLLGDGAPVGVSLCGGVQLTTVLASPRDLAKAHHTARAFGQGFLTLAVSVPWGRTRLVADFGPAFAFTRPQFFLLQSNGSKLDVHQPARVGAIFRLALIIPAP